MKTVIMGLMGLALAIGLVVYTLIPAANGISSVGTSTKGAVKSMQDNIKVPSP